MHQVREVINWAMIGQMPIAIAVAWIERSWTFGDPYFSFDVSFSLPMKIYRLEV